MLTFKITSYEYHVRPSDGPFPDSIDIRGQSTLDDESVIEITISNPTKEQIQEVMEAYDPRYSSLSADVLLIGNFSNERS